MNRMQKNLANHYRRLFASAAVSITYARGGQAMSLEAVQGQTPVHVEDSDGQLVRSKRSDWIIRAADLILGDENITPMVSDTIRVDVNKQTATYEVQRIAGEDCYYECDDLGTYLRIHTRQVNTDNEA